jgi:hypothetical protein
MATKDITDAMVCTAYAAAAEIRELTDEIVWPDKLLMDSTKQPEKVVLCAMERAYDRGLIECGVTLRSGWLTASGKALVLAHNP